MSPMFPDNSVTYVPGCSQKPELKAAALGQSRYLPSMAVIVLRPSASLRGPMIRRMAILTGAGMAVAGAAAAQPRPALNLNTHSEIIIDRPPAAIWPSIRNPSRWKRGATLSHQSGPAGQLGEVFAARDPADTAKVLFLVENVELTPNRRRTIKLYEPSGGLVGYATWWLREQNGKTVVGYDVYSETLVDSARAKTMTPAQLHDTEQSALVANRKRFDEELRSLKRLVEGGDKTVARLRGGASHLKPPAP